MQQLDVHYSLVVASSACDSLYRFLTYPGPCPCSRSTDQGYPTIRRSANDGKQSHYRVWPSRKRQVILACANRILVLARLLTGWD